MCQDVRGLLLFCFLDLFGGVFLQFVEMAESTCSNRRVYGWEDNTKVVMLGNRDVPSQTE